jgi:hemerythrin superfamily protein
MEATALLKKDHATVRALFKQFEKTGDRSEQKKQRIIDEIKAELDIHTAVEEEIFYPTMQELGSKEANDLVLEAIEEHKIVKTLLAQIAALTPADEEFDAKVKVLQENVEHHAGEEEKEMFPQARKHLSDAKRKDLGKQMEARKARGGVRRSDADRPSASAHS